MKKYDKSIIPPKDLIVRFDEEDDIIYLFDTRSCNYLTYSEEFGVLEYNEDSSMFSPIRGKQPWDRYVMNIFKRIKKIQEEEKQNECSTKI